MVLKLLFSQLAKIKVYLLQVVTKSVFFYIFIAVSIFAAEDVSFYNELIDGLNAREVFDQNVADKMLSSADNKARQMSLVSKLRTFYCEQYFQTHSTRIVQLESFINEFFGEESRLGYFIFLTDREIFNEWTQAEFDYLSKIATTQTDNDRLNYALDLYVGLKILQQHEIAIDDYKKVADCLDRALAYKDSDIHYEQLRTALKNVGDFARLFELDLWRYYDRKNENLADGLLNYLAYKKITEPKFDYKTYCATIKNSVLQKYFDTFAKSRPECPAKLNLTNDYGEMIELDLKHSETNKLVVFFSVTCANCIDEMNVLNEMMRDLAKKNIEIIAIYTMFNNPAYAINELETFNNKHKLSFKTFCDEKNILWKTFGFTHVPYLLLIDKNGEAIGSGSFDHYGNIAEKINFLTKLFVDKTK